MALINLNKRELHCKLVYFGPSYSGKTANLQYIREQLPSEDRSDLVAIATETERTLFFQFRSAYRMRGFTIIFHLYAIQGAVLHKDRAVAVLKGADGIVFVADSRSWCGVMEQNQRLVRSLLGWLKEYPKRATLPILMQYNRRDTANAVPIPELDYYLNPLKWPTFEAIAPEGVGVMPTLETLCKQVIARLQSPPAAGDAPRASRFDDALALFDDRVTALPSSPQLHTDEWTKHVIMSIVLLLIACGVVGLLTGFYVFNT